MGQQWPVTGDHYFELCSVELWMITSENPSLVIAGCDGEAVTGSVPISGSCTLGGAAPASLLGILCR